MQVRRHTAAPKQSDRETNGRVDEPRASQARERWAAVYLHPSREVPGASVCQLIEKSSGRGKLNAQTCEEEETWAVGAPASYLTVRAITPGAQAKLTDVYPDVKVIPTEKEKKWESTVTVACSACGKERTTRMGDKENALKRGVPGVTCGPSQTETESRARTQ